MRGNPASQFARRSVFDNAHQAVVEPPAPKPRVRVKAALPPEPPAAHWREALPCAPVAAAMLTPAVLPVFTWAAERGICELCQHMRFADPAMLCGLAGRGTGTASGTYCIDERSSAGRCGPGALLFEQKSQDEAR